METKPQKHSVFIISGFGFMAASIASGLYQNWLAFGLTLAGLIIMLVGFFVNIAHLDIDARFDEVKKLIVELKANKPKEEQKQ